MATNIDSRGNMKVDILVVGGGIAGITAAVEAAETGKTVALIEKEHYLGGRVAQLYEYFPKMCPPSCGLEINFRRIRQSGKITVLTGATTNSIEGEPGSYKVQVEVAPRYVNEKCTACGDCAAACDLEVEDDFNFGILKAKAVRLPYQTAFPYRFMIDAAAIGDPALKAAADACKYEAIDLEMQVEAIEVEASAIVWATGWEPYDANKLVELNYAKHPNIVTNMIMERLSANAAADSAKMVKPSDAGEISSIAFVQCAGSRDENHLSYCSAVCCMASLKQSRYIREQYPDAEIHIFFIDARTPGRWEDFYQDVQDDEKTIIHRGKVASIVANDNNSVALTAENTLTGKLENITVDMAVLATGMQPRQTTKPPATVNLDEYGFIVNNGKPNIIGAGVATGPKDVATSNEDATAAVARALMSVGR
ncbi:FAD-dependent oxidoreductase [Calditrichota bacterium]